MIEIVRTDADHKGFVALVKLLDADLARSDGDEHAFYNQFNKIDKIKHVIIAYENGIAVSCGAIKAYDKSTMEVKRMFTSLPNRGRGLASIVLEALEKWAKELSYEKCILETGVRQPDAIRLYEKNGYRLIPNYGQYADVANSKCFEKRIQ